MKKIFWKFIAFVEALVLISSFLVTAITSQDYSGSCGESASYTLNAETGLLKIEGTEKISSGLGNPNSVPWFEMRHLIKSVEISDGITNVPDRAFYEYVNLESIKLPSSLTVIGYEAFKGCTSLSSIQIPEGVTEICASAFINCTSLYDIVIPDSVQMLGRDCFFNTAYYNDPSNWENGSLYNRNRLLAVKTDLTGHYTIKPDTLLIAEFAFYRCEHLTGITIPDSVTSIGYGAFSECSGLKSLTIPDSVSFIGEFAFGNCYSLEYLSMPWVSNSNIVDFGAYFGEYNEFISGKFHGTYPPYEIPKTLETVVITGEKDLLYPAFVGVHTVDNIVISGNVKKVAGAFFQCTLKRVTFSENVESFSDGVFSRCTVELVRLFKDSPADKAVNSKKYRKMYLNEDVAPGDVDMDGKVDENDAKRLAQYLADWITSANENAADCNNDKTIDIKDIIIIAQYISGQAVNLG